MVSQRQSKNCFCQKYLDLLAENARLQEQLERLKSKLARQERTAKEQPFGLSTPSSQKLVKPSLPEMDEAEIKRRKGGASPGHVGHGWKEPEGPAPEIEELAALLKPVYKALMEVFRNAAVKHADETRCAPAGHRPQGQPRLAVRGRAGHALGAHERAAHARRLLPRSRRPAEGGARPLRAESGNEFARGDLRRADAPRADAVATRPG